MTSGLANFPRNRSVSGQARVCRFRRNASKPKPKQASTAALGSGAIVAVKVEGVEFTELNNKVPPSVVTESGGCCHCRKFAKPIIGPMDVSMSHV